MYYLYIHHSLYMLDLKCLLKTQDIIYRKKISIKNIKKRWRAFVTVIKNSTVKQKRATYCTCSNSLNKQNSIKRRRHYTQRRTIFLTRKSGKTQTIALLIHKKNEPREAFCSNKLNPKLHTACDFLSTKSRHDFKFDAVLYSVHAFVSNVFLPCRWYSFRSFEGF